MNLKVIDTNVILAANNAHDDISMDCRIACVETLQDIMRNGAVVIDNDYLILKEYQRQMNPGRQKGPGDVFLKWLLQNSANPARCHRVTLTQLGEHEYVEFPVPEL